MKNKSYIEGYSKGYDEGYLEGLSKNPSSYKKGWKEGRKQLVEEIKGMKSRIVGNGNDYYSGFNQALLDILTKLKEESK